MFLVLCGKSGAGKDTVAKKILERHPDAKMAVSVTSRPMRPGEVEGREYFFVTREEFLKRRDAGDFIESRSFFVNNGGNKEEWFYATPKFEPKEELTIFIKDPAGAKVIKDYCESIEAPFECVLLEVPDTLREERAMERGGFYKAEWDRRMDADAVDFSEEKIAPVVSKVVVNDGRFSLDQIADFCYYAGMHAEKESGSDLFPEIESEDVERNEV